MRLVTAAVGRGTAVCAVVDGELFAIGADAGRFDDLAAYFRGGEAAKQAAVAATIERPSGGPAFGAVVRPVLAPEAVVCVGLNYRTHVDEVGLERPAYPTWFSKLPRALTDPFARIAVPNTVRQLDYEGEFAVIIGVGGRNIPRERAWGHVGGVTLMNDVSARDYQRRTTQWFAGKSWHASTPWGPVVVTPDELPEAEILVEVNGELRQSGTLSDLVFDVPSLIEDASRIFELRPGDVIATGTPGGVGMSFEPERYLQPGDVVCIRSPQIGALTNVVVPESELSSRVGAGA